MSQNLRNALWVPTAAPTAIGDNIVSIAAPTSSGSIATQFSLAGGTSIGDAPSDGQQYGRRNGAWTVIYGFIGEAPTDGRQYGRQSAGWTVITAPAILDGGTF